MKSITSLCAIFFLSINFLSASVNINCYLNTDPTPKNYIAPSFQGGNEALFNFIEENLVYPAEARELQKEGIVQVRLYIDQDGKVSNIIVRDCETPCFEQSILDLVEKMPRWNPATADGKKVKAGINLNITFELED